MTDSVITTEQQGHLWLIGLNRPHKYNAFSVEMFTQLAQALSELENRDDLRCAVIYAHGDHFTAGIDLAQWSPLFSDGTGLKLPDGLIDPMCLNESIRQKPVVVAVHGICFTIGIELLLACDIRVAADNTRFAQIEIKRGIYPVGGATIRFPMEAGWGNAMRYLLTGDEFNAEEAYRIGIVQEVTPFGQHVDKAIEIADTIAKQAPLGVYATLKSARLTRHKAEQDSIPHLMPDLLPLMQSEDVQEGIQSFLERREAVFQGK